MSLLRFPELLARRFDWLERWWRPLLAAALVAGPFVVLFVMLRDLEGVRIYDATSAHGGRIRGDLEREVASRELVVRDLASRWEGQADVTQKAWAADADSLVRSGLQFRAFQWLEPSLAVRFSVPTGVTLPGAVLDSVHDETRRDELTVILAEAPTVSRSFPLPEEPRQFLIVAPLREGGRVTGYMMGVLRAVDLLDAALREPVQRGLTAQVVENSYQIFGAVWLDAGDEGAFASEQRVKVGDLDWTLTIWPSADYVKHERSKELIVMLAFGILLGLAAATLTHRAGARRRAASTERVPSPPAEPSAEPAPVVEAS